MRRAVILIMLALSAPLPASDTPTATSGWQAQYDEAERQIRRWTWIRDFAARFLVQEADTKVVYVSANEPPAVTDVVRDDDRVHACVILTDWSVGPGPDGAAFDPHRLDYSLEHEVPEGWEGPIIIDREGAPLRSVLDWTTGARDELARRREVIAYIRARFPKATFGDYGLVTTRARTGDWVSDPPAELIAYLGELDMLCPSVYDGGPGPISPMLVSLMQIANAIGDRVERPVIAFFTHRYHESNPTHGFQLVPQDEAVAHVAAVAEYCDGAVGWEGDPYWFANRSTRSNDAATRAVQERRAAWFEEHTPTLEAFLEWHGAYRVEFVRWIAEALN